MKLSMNAENAILLLQNFSIRILFDANTVQKVIFLISQPRCARNAETMLTLIDNRVYARFVLLTVTSTIRHKNVNPAPVVSILTINNLNATLAQKELHTIKKKINAYAHQIAQPLTNNSKSANLAQI